MSDHAHREQQCVRASLLATPQPPPTTDKIAKLWSTDAETLHVIDSKLAKQGFDASFVMMKALREIDSQIEAIDRRIENFEWSRMAVLKSIGQYSEASARRLAASTEVIEGEYTEAAEWVMTSERKIISNRKNAQKSTGPRSELGRLGSRRNALRHGLSIAIGSDASFSKDIESLATILASGRRGQLEQEFARQGAEAHLDLVRIRQRRAERLDATLGNPKSTLEDYAELNNSLALLERYERRAFSRRKRALLAMSKH